VLDAADTRSLALLYHLNSLPSPSAEADPTLPWPRIRETRGSADGVRLPAAGRSGLLELIGARRSCRKFAAEALPLPDLSALLAGTYGLTGSLSVVEGLDVGLRAVPSAGALYPLDLLVLATDVDGLETGLHHYDSDVHALVPLDIEIDRERLDAAIIASPFVRNAAALVFIVAVFDRTLRKYSARGYRYILLEAGHAAQNLCLLATERGLGSLCLGGFVDVAVNKLLGLDWRVEGVVYCVGVGYGEYVARNASN
jgi:SagB-type dehydrogenase family enzyme